MGEAMKIARDCFYTPIYMKKNRPAYKLSILCDKENIEKVEDLIFSNTTSIGIRKIEVERSTLEREIIKIDHEGLEISYKKVFHKDKTYLYPEYESALSLAKTKKLSIKEAFEKMNMIYGEYYEKI